MEGTGRILLWLGIILGVYAFSMDTSVEVDYRDGNPYGMPERINNIGLMNDQSNYLMVAGVMAAIGIFLQVKSKNKNTESEGENAKPTSQIDELVKIKALKDEGTLTQSEFDALKEKILTGTKSEVS